MRRIVGDLELNLGAAIVKTISSYSKLCETDGDVDVGQVCLCGCVLDAIRLGGGGTGKKTEEDATAQGRQSLVLDYVVSYRPSKSC